MQIDEVVRRCTAFLNEFVEKGIVTQQQVQDTVDSMKELIDANPMLVSAFDELTEDQLNGYFSQMLGAIG